MTRKETLLMQPLDSEAVSKHILESSLNNPNIFSNIETLNDIQEVHEYAYRPRINIY